MMKRIILIVAVCVLALAGRASAQIALIQGSSAGSLDTNTATTSGGGGFDSTGANAMYAGLAWFGAGTPVVTDNKSNACWALGTVSTCASNYHAAIARCENLTSTGSGHQVTVTLNGSYPGIVAVAFSNVLTSSSYDQRNEGNSSSSATVQTGSVTPSVDNELLLALVGFNFNQTITIAPSSGWSDIPTQVGYSAGNNIGAAMAYQVQTTKSAQNPTWTASTALSDMCTAIITVKDSGASGAASSGAGGMLLNGIGK